MLWSVDPSLAQPLAEQIAASVRRAIADGELGDGDRLAPAAELATLLDVHTNTVLAAYRRLREENLLEFKRGRGVRVSGRAAGPAAVGDAARRLLEMGRMHGYSTEELIQIVGDLGRGIT